MPDQDIDNFPIIDLDDELPIVDIEKDRKKSKLKAPSKPIKPISITPEMGEASLAQQEKILKERSEKLQQFKRPSLPPQDLSPDKFRFETTPFRETPEQYLERSAPPKRLPTTIRPEEKGKGRLQALKEGRLLTAIFGDPLPESEKIRQEQRLYDTLGPTGYSVVEGVRRAGRMIGEPFEQTYGRVLEGEMPGGPPKPVRPPIPLIRQEREAPISKVLPPAIEYGSMFIPLRARGGGPRIDEGPLPELGGQPPRVPPQVGPGRVIEGQPSSGGPLELRRGRTIVGFPTVRPPEKPVHIPPPPDMLARRGVEPFPMHDQLIMSERVGPVGEPIADDLSFDLVLSPQPGKAPVLAAPEWFLDMIRPGNPPGGFHITFPELPSLHLSMLREAPSPEHLTSAIGALVNAHKASAEQGLQSIAVVSRSLTEEERSSPKYIGHETFHSGQAKIGLEKLGSPTTYIHSPEWAEMSPYIQDLIAKYPEKMTSNDWGMEAPTYIWAGQGDYYNKDVSKNVDFLYEYFDHIGSLYGPEALQTAEDVAWSSPEALEIIRSARSTYESRERERISTSTLPGTEVEGRSTQEIGVRGIPQMEGGGLEPRGDKERVGGPSGQVESSLSEPPPGRDPVEWYHSQLEKVVEGSKFPNKMSSEQAMSMLSPYASKHGIKMEMYEKSGIDELIARKSTLGEQVTKEELLDVIRTSKVSLEEKVYGEVDQPRIDELNIKLDEEASLFQEFQQDAFQTHERLLEAIDQYWRGEIDEGKLDKISQEYETTEQLVNRVRGRMDVLNHELMKAKGTPALHTQYKALKGGIPGTDKEIVISVPPDKEESTTFISPHYSGVENPIVHFRINEMSPIDGKKTMVLQEIQSDLHQKGREEGYQPLLLTELPPGYELRPNKYGNFQLYLGDERMGGTFQSKQEALHYLSNKGIPDLPFKQTWIDLAVKRVIRWAADNGFEKIVWPTGKMQIDLYDDAIRQNVTAIRWESDLDGIHLYPIKPDDPSGDNSGAYHEQLQKLTPEKLKEIVGPKIADQILSQIDGHMGRGTIEGDDLSIGGQLHKFVYDTRLPQIFKEYAKKFGGSYEIAQTGDQQVHSFTLSPKLREKARYEGFALSEKEPTYTIGDRIKVKGMGPAKVTKVFDDGLEVTYESNNAVDEINFNAIESKLSDVTPGTSKVTKVTSIVTPKGSEKGRVPSLPGPMRIKKNRLFVNRIGPGDEPGKVKIEFGNGTISQFDIKDIKDASGRKIKDPIYYMLIEDPPEGIISPPPPPTPRDPSYPPGGDSPLFAPIVGVTHTRVIAKKFIDLMTTNKIEYDTTKPPSTQIYEAMIKGDLKDLGVENILKEEGIEWDDFIEDVLGTYSVAGKTLQPLSEIEQRHWKRLRDENPALFNKLVPAHRQIQLILDDLNKTTLGMSLWRRSGRMIQKAVLTQVATAATNFIGATGRVPMDAGSSAIGQAMRQIREGEGTFGEKMDKAREASRETFKAGFEAWRALNPMQIEALSRGQLGKEYEGYENIVQQLETYFPDLHAKLFTKPMEETAQKLTGEKLPLHVELDPRTKLVGARENVNNMKMLLPKVKNKTKRRFLQQEIHKLESNIKREERVITKMGFRAPEMFYDQLLRPMQFGEFLMRKARFVSRLGLELKDRGVDLNQVIQEGSFKNIPSDAIKSSINDALEFTMALEPTNDPNANNFERASYHVVKLMNHLGPIALVTDTLFVRAMYSAFNTFYEYSPMPLLNPGEWMQKGSFGRIFRGKNDLDPATGEPYRTNPASRDDYDKFGRMAVGTILYALAAALIKFGLIGDNWYEVKTGKKDKKGNPIYVDIRRYIPQARIFQLAYLIDRGFTDRMADVHIGREALDIATGIKRYETDPDLISTLDAIGEYWGGPDWNPREIDKSSQFLGRYPAALLTPLLNIRSMIAAHDEDENIKKDLRGSGFWGPSIDRFPWLRQRLPDLTYPTYQGKIPLSESPALQQFGGVQVSTSPDFMGREFNRMGISIREYLQRDPDPVIDKAQNEIFSQITGLIGESLEANPEYISASNNEKAALWEMYLKGDNGIVSQVKEAALQANPIEAARRGIMRQVPGRFIRKTTGITETLEGMREK